MRRERIAGISIKNNTDWKNAKCIIPRHSLRKLFIYSHLSKSQEVKMREKFQLKGAISEPSSDITKLYAMLIPKKMVDK